MLFRKNNFFANNSGDTLVTVFLRCKNCKLLTNKDLRNYIGGLESSRPRQLQNKSLVPNFFQNKAFFFFQNIKVKPSNTTASLL